MIICACWSPGGATYTAEPAATDLDALDALAADQVLKLLAAAK